MKRYCIVEPHGDLRAILQQQAAVPVEDAGRRGADLGQVFSQRQVWVGLDFVHRNTTRSEPHNQASRVRTGNGRPLCSNQYPLWVNTRSAVAVAGIRSETRPSLSVAAAAVSGS